ncbi:response regulator transcription factor [Corynebacterium sp. YIM 101645]|uniref:Alkaline phosphatase synthesis transcriptional regulatory protein PhoP n=2 Tax=Corynebacterium TaxID=1716 RepID=A0A6B8VKP1_9CORY|nr:MULTISPECIES: response regulator transcription factor [Corynebacterium]MCS5480592.1 response regulator transcription factor [Corynebacterium lemuris]QGU05962.1 Alkaline phosphatase synthesis transcriptional regulatory protein PhoP [Corynebacterium comes]
MVSHTTAENRPAGRVLVVDDEKPLAEMVATYLERAGFTVTQAHTGPQALEEARRFTPDVIVLDLGLPGMDGLQVCRQIRAFSDCYILMLTARGSEDDKITGLTAGADDYITKPFSIRELVTRIHAVLRRPRATTMATPLTVGELVIDPIAHEARVGDVLVDLTRTECELLAVLALRRGQVLSRHELVTDVWDTSWVGDERIIDVHIGNLRRKLGTDSKGRGFIETVRGVGYRMGRA